MLGQKPAPLRSALLNLKIQPTLHPPRTAITIPTLLYRQLSTTTNPNNAPPKPSPHRPTLIKPSHNTSTLTPIRPLSQIPTTTTPSTQYTPPSTQYTPSSTPSTPLTWNTYLALRKTRRRYNLFFSLTTSLTTTILGASYLAPQSLESMSVFSLDPVIVLGISMTAFMGAGWLMGPFLGNALFRVRYRQQWEQIAEKEKDLFRRIKKYRVDGSGGSSANPVPDYYGEKIDSVRGYRNWMKDQRAFNKKRQNFL